MIPTNSSLAFLWKWMICLLVLCSYNSLFAQETITSYIKHDGKITTIKDSADYTRVVHSRPNKQGHYNFHEYYPNGNLKRQGAIQHIDSPDLMFEGLLEIFYPNGNVRSLYHFSKGQIIDTAQDFYPDGQLKIKMIYPSENIPLSERHNFNNLLDYYADSTGHVFIQNGAGTVEVQLNEIDQEQGSYSQGVKEGAWHGTFQNGRYRFEESYEKGELTQGVSTDSSGNEYPYHTAVTNPSYPGGVNKLLQFIGRKFQLPQAARRAKVKGQITISFLIDESGTPGHFNVVRDLGYNTGEAAVQVIKQAKKWTPARSRGVPIPYQYTLPITVY